MENNNIYAARISLLRELMEANGWDAAIITGTDPHQSEYPAQRWKQVEWLTGFTGEAAEVVITKDHAGLWTDSRYFIQSGIQLRGTGVILHKTRVPEEIPVPRWLEEELGQGAFVVVDSLCQSTEAVQALQARGLNPVLKADFLEQIWEGRPGIPQSPICRIQSGEGLSDKLCWLREEIGERGAVAALITSLDEIAWMLNIRASDIDYNPLCISYLLVGGDYAKWYVLKDEPADAETRRTFAFLSDAGIEILPYCTLGKCEGPLLVDPSSLNAEVERKLDCRTIEWDSPIKLRKAIKNDYEISCLRSVHAEDGAAMEKFLYWLEKSLCEGRRISEWDAAVKLGMYRSQIGDYRGDSFQTISAYGSSAALPHYTTPSQNAPTIEAKGLYLVDSGGQFLRGTTDITRTIPVGECSEQEIRDYTLVLKGHIALACAVFPEGTPGCRLDALAREPLWKEGLNFGHGTGHGVGFFLGCHESPQDIRQNLNPVPFEEGMVVSDEPGLYVEGSHGVRHENLLLCVADKRTPFGSFLKFETLTLCHFDTSIVDMSLLSEDEKNWLKAYNRRVYRELFPLLPGEVAAWLKKKTEEF